MILNYSNLFLGLSRGNPLVVAKINNEERGTEKEERKTKNIEHRKENEERHTGVWDQEVQR